MNVKIADLYALPILTITQAVIALGSNVNSKQAYQIALSELDKVAHVQCSDVIVGQDYTGRSTHIYHNACVRLTFIKPLNFDELNQKLKRIESQCGQIGRAHV